MEHTQRPYQDELVARVHKLQEALAQASRRFGKPPLLLAVTKNQPPERINLLAAAGLDQIAESRAQDWRDKSDHVNKDFILHWIGRLQTNKIRYIIEQVYLVHSLDRPELAEALGHSAEQVHRRVPVLVQVNVAKEPQKAGLDPQELLPFLQEYGKHPGIAIQGLMAMMPAVPDPESLRPYFSQMRETFDEIPKRAIFGVEMRHLSMGMSADCIVAAQEGATIVRVGSALFEPNDHRIVL